MTTIKAHFDGKVFVPDEPVDLRPGDVVTVTGVETGSTEPSNRSGRESRWALNIDIDPKTSHAIALDPEFNVEES